MGFLSGLIVLENFQVPNYGVGQGNALLGPRRQRMVVARSWLSYRRPELVSRCPKAAMNLAKPRIDIGFATNNAPAALAFWQNEIGLPFDYTQPIRRGSGSIGCVAVMNCTREAT